MTTTTETLTDSQIEAIKSKDKEILVIAGAGSGKTRVLAERIVSLFVDRGMLASDLMVLTFTRKAADELKDRVTAALHERFGEDADSLFDGMMIGTFHSVALGILRQFGDMLGYTATSLTVIDQDDSELLLMQVCRDLGYVHGKKWRHGLSMKKVKEYVEARYAEKYLSVELLILPELQRVFIEYTTRLFNMNVLDFGSILRQCNRLFREHPDVLLRYRRSIRAVLVDEIQDTDEAQFNLHEWFMGGDDAADFFAVGDTRQTIYNWRGARPDLMHKRHPDAMVIDLRECFRCGDRIVNVANSLISHNTDEKALPMIGATGRAGTVSLLAGRSEAIASECVAAKSAGFAWADIAILARSNRELKRLSDVFTEEEIPHRRVGGGYDVCRTTPFKTLHAALRLVLNPKDDLAFMRLQDVLGIRGSQYAAVVARARSKGLSDFDAIRPWSCSFIKAIDAAIDGETLTVHQVAVRLVARMPRASIAEYIDSCSFWLEHCTKHTVTQSLEWYAAVKGQQDSLKDCHDDAMPKAGYATLATVHAAKGLEWPCVIVANMNEKTFPSSMSIKSDSVDDERRLAYVAFTRAKERLVLHYRREQDHNPDRGSNPPSRFLTECGVIPS